MNRQDATSYSNAWRSYRWWSRAFWLSFVLFLPGVASADRVLRPLPGGANATLAVVFAWMLAFLVFGYKKFNFECPRCGELFFRKFDDRPYRMDWEHKPWARRCMHCSLLKWTSDPNAPPS
jgi:hypothetical protein